MNPYGVAQSYCEAPSKSVTAAPYIEPVPYIAIDLPPLEQYDKEDNLTFIQEASGNVTAVNDYITYGTPFAYGEPYPYAGLPKIDVTYKTEDFLTFNEEAKLDYIQALDTLAFVQESSIIHDAGDLLIFDHPVYNITSDTLTLVQEVSHSTATLAAEDTLTFSEASGPTEPTDNSLTFSEPVAVINSPIDVLTFVQETAGVAAKGGLLTLGFSQELTWSKTHGDAGESQLSIHELVTYHVVRNNEVVGSGGSGYVPNPISARIIAHVTVGVHVFRMDSSYRLDVTFSNGLYLNGGAKYTLALGRPLSIVGDWQLVLKDLIGRQQTVTNLLADPFEVFVSDESSLTSEGMELVFYALEHDTRGVI